MSSLLLLLFIGASSVEPMIPSPPALDAESYLVMDFRSGKILAEKEPDLRLPPASITKMLTSYVVFDEIESGRLRLDDTVRISEKAWRTGGSRMFVEVDTEVSVQDLLRGVIIQSGNDASVALAEKVAGSEAVFAELMNAHAERLGMTGSHFVNATGLPAEEHYVTARDVAILAAALVRDFPDLYPMYSEREFTFNNIRQHNRNVLLWRDPAVDGLKTGHTEAAGYCLAATAARDDMRLISVLMGAESERARADLTQQLLDWGFRFHETHTLFKRGDELATAKVWKGSLQHLPLGVAESVTVTIPRGSYDDLEAHMDLRTRISAPVQQGQQLGTLRVSLAGSDVAEEELIALAGVERGSMWRRFNDSIRLWFADE